MSYSIRDFKKNMYILFFFSHRIVRSRSNHPYIIGELCMLEYCTGLQYSLKTKCHHGNNHWCSLFTGTHFNDVRLTIEIRAKI